MRIGIVHSNMDVIGGAEKTTFSLIEALAKSSHSVTLYTTSKINNSKINCLIKRIGRLPFPIFWKILRNIENGKLLKAAENEDVVIIMSGGLSLKHLDIPIVVYCHSTFESDLDYVNSSNSGLKKIYDSFVKKQVLRQLNLLKDKSVHLITNSYYTEQKIKENFGKDSSVIYPPVEQKISQNDTKRQGVVTVSRYSPEKNLTFACEVAMKVGASYKVIGNAKFQTQYNILNTLTKMCKTNPKIKLLCNVEKKVITDSLLSSKVYFQTSKETFGMAVIEGIAAGCIPIVPNNTANKETVPFTELRYKPGNVNEAQKLITKALDGEFDDFKEKLWEHIKQFSKANFQEKMLKYISKFEEKRDYEEGWG